jgi:hypothetical protein
MSVESVRVQCGNKKEDSPINKSNLNRGEPQDKGSPEARSRTCENPRERRHLQPSLSSSMGVQSQEPIQGK